jgi:hypothetical protein
MKVQDGPQRLLSFLDAYGWFIKAAEPISQWRTDDDALPVQFESLVGDFSENIQINTIKSICEHLGIHTSDFDKKEAIKESISSKTITWSGNRTQRSLYWSDEVDRQFKKLGGTEINRSLGYL